VIHDLVNVAVETAVSEDSFVAPAALPQIGRSVEGFLRDPVESVAVVYAGDYLNKLSGESVERECRLKIEEGVKELVVNFSRTEIVNSIGVSILLGVIDAARSNGANVLFADVNENTAELFEMLGLTNHVQIVQSLTAIKSNSETYVAN
jgi:anti-anti-sigma factor